MLLARHPSSTLSLAVGKIMNDFGDIMPRAYHEAAHAVFSYHARYPIYYLAMTTDDGPELDDGCAAGTPREPTKEDLLLSAAISLSGYYAEAYARTGEIDPSLEPRVSFEQFTSLAEAGVIDCMKALRCIRLAVGPFSLEGQRATYEELCTLVAELVEERADEIAAVACRLAESGYLSGSARMRTIELTSRQRSEVGF